MSTRAHTIWNLAAGQRLRFAAAIVSLVVASCFLYLAPLVPQVVIDGVIAPGPGEASGFVAWSVERLGGRAFLRANLWWPAVVIAILTGFAGVFTYLRGRWSAAASESIVRRVRDRVYDHLQHLPASFFDEAETGDLIQRCTSDTETLRVFLSTQVVEIGRAMVMLLVPLPLMLAIDVRMTIASVIVIPLVVGFSLVFFVKVKSAFKASDEAEGRLTTTVQENLTGIRVVRAFARQDFECEKFGGRNREHRDLDYRLYVILAWFWSCSDLLCFLQKAIVVAFGVYLLTTGELSVGAFYYFITAVSMFIWPVRMMGRILADLGKATVALGRLGDILDEPVESTPATPIDVASFPGEVVFDDVSFSHGESSPVLRGVSFTVPAGRTLAILGPSGSGKSTVVNLLLRLYDHDSGSIRLDGHELGRLDRRQVRRQLAVVMQEPFLYSKTLRDNVRLGRPSVSEDEIVQSTTVACVHDSILEFEKGYDTLIGERGVTLSGGQRQRIALARALLQDPAVLVLDDALSAVDARTESMILDALRTRRGRHTTIVIAHRLSTLMHADEIIVLESGRIVQRGVHETLVAEEGLYRRLWNIQRAVEDGVEIEIADRKRPTAAGGSRSARSDRTEQ